MKRRHPETSVDAVELAARHAKRGRWALRMAVRATLTAVVAIVVGYMVDHMALSKLAGEASDSRAELPVVLQWAAVFHGVLAVVPVPALLAGIAALILRPLRGLLAPLASILVFAAFGVILLALLAGLLPMYAVPEGLDLTP
ncbi:MAG: hypothetical protein JXA69_13440 [Phycisphaerae bacterium]|nr:hypothetical protein [Phycisphaerae bacterium]